MNRPRLIKGLRIAWTAWWGIICVLLSVLWVASYSYTAGVFWSHGHRRVFTTKGQLFYDDGDGGYAWDSRSKYIQKTIQFSQDKRIYVQLIIPAGTGVQILNYTTRLRYWPFSLSAAFLAAAPWILSCRTVSLRTLLIATTVIAVVLGLVVWSSG